MNKAVLMPMLLNGANRPRRSVKRHDAIGGEDIVQDCRHMSTHIHRKTFSRKRVKKATIDEF